MNLDQVFVTADHHFGHSNIIGFCQRPFEDVWEMDEGLITNWNEAVGPEDVVYHLGDLTLRSCADRYLSNLNGTIRLVPGGHDRRWLKDLSGLPLLDVLPPLYSLEVDVGQKRPLVVVLCHYPMLSWDRSHYGSLHLHGHSHGTIPDSLSADTKLPPDRKKGSRIDVGVDSWNFAPVSLASVLEKIS